MLRKGTDNTGRFRHLFTLAFASAAALGVAQSASATVLFADDFESAASNNIAPPGWTSLRNWTTNEADPEPLFAPTSWQTTSAGAGHPFYGHDWDGGPTGSRFVAAAGNGTAGVIDLWLVSPSIAFNGSAATISFWTFSLSSSQASLEVRLSAAGNTIPTNGGDRDNGLPDPLTGGVGDFTTELLTINPDRQAGVYATWDNDFNPLWTEYTINIPAGLVSGDGYIAFRGYGSNVFGDANQYRIVALDDVVVTAVPEPTALGLAAIAGMAVLRRRRAAC